MNIFTAHTQKQGVTYIEHLIFAMRIALRLSNSVIAFSLHAIFPFIDIKKNLDLEETVRFINVQNKWIEGMKKNRKHEQIQSPVLQTRESY